jgi:hypothetical protein
MNREPSRPAAAPAPVRIASRLVNFIFHFLR